MEGKKKSLKKLQRDHTAADLSVRPFKSRLGPEIQNKIGQHLRRFYSEIVNEGVPQRFADLLRDLDKHE